MRQAVHLVLPGTLNKFNLKVHMPHLSFNSDSLDVSRFDYKDEDIRALRQSVSVQMHVMVDAATHPSGCGFGITLFDLQEDPDIYSIAGKKIRLLAPTVSGSGTKFKVLLDNTLLGEVDVPNLLSNSTALTEFRFWRQVDGYKAMYLIDGTLQATVTIPDTVLGPNVRFKAGVSLVGNCSVNLYTLVYSNKDAVAKTIALQGSGSFTIPAGQQAIVLQGRGGAGTVTVFDLGQVTAPSVSKIIFNDILPPSYFVEELPLMVYGFIGGNILANEINTLQQYGENLIYVNPRASGTALIGGLLTNDNFETIVTVPKNLNPEKICYHDGYFYFKHGIYTSASGTTLSGESFTRDFNKVYRTTNFETIETVKTYTSKVLVLQILQNNNGDKALYITTEGNGTTRDRSILDLNTMSWSDTQHPQTAVLDTDVLPSGNIKVHSNKFYSSYNGYLLVSENLLSWTIKPGIFPSFTNALDLVFGNGLICTRSATNRIDYSADDGNTINTYVPPTPVDKLLYSAGVFTLFSQSGQTYTCKTFDTVVAHPEHTTGISFLKNGYVLFTANERLVGVKILSGAYSRSLGIVVYVGPDIDNMVPLELNTYSATYGSFAYNNKTLVIEANPECKLKKQGKRESIVAYVLDTEFGIKTTSVGLLGQTVSANIDGVNQSFPQSKTNYLPTIGKISKNVLITDTPEINYTAPIETLLRATYLDTPSVSDGIGKFISYSCNGFHKTEIRADGNGGTYETIIVKNSIDCGYNADTLKTIMLSGNGTIVIPEGTSSITLSGRGSSMVDKTLAIAASPISLNFDILNSPVKNIKQVVSGGGRVLVLADTPKRDTDHTGNTNNLLVRNKQKEARSIWVGDDLSNLVKLDTPDGFKAYSAEYLPGANVFIINAYNNRCLNSSASNVFADWVQYDPPYGITRNTYVCDNELKVINRINNFYSEDGITFTKNRFLNRLTSSFPRSLYDEGTTDFGKRQNTGIYFMGLITDAYIDNTSSSPRRGGFVYKDGLFSSIPNLDSNAQSGYYNVPGEEENQLFTATYLSEVYLGASKNIITDFAVNSQEEIFGIVGPRYSGHYTDDLSVIKGLELRPVVKVDSGTGESYKTLEHFRSRFTIQATTTCTDDVYIVADIGELYYNSDCKNPNGWVKFNLDKRLKNDISNPFSHYATTYYQSSIQGIPYSKKIPAGEPYVAKLLEYGKTAFVTIGDKLKIIPGNKYSTAPASEFNEVITVDPGKETVIVYNCPEGSSVSIQYMAVNDGSPVAGTLLNTVCDGFNKNGVYANGVGGTYTNLIEANSLDCGYVVPVIKASIAFSNTTDIVEDEIKVLKYSLNQPLDVDIGLTVNTVFNAAANASDIGDLESKINGVVTPITSGTEITVPTGTIEFNISFKALFDEVSEPIEGFTLNLTPTTNSGRVLTTNIDTVVSITSVDMLLEPSNLSYDGSDYDKRMPIGTYSSNYDVIRGTVNKYGIIKTEIGRSSGKYYIPLTGINLKTMIVGFGNSSMSLDGGTTTYTYPGMDINSWGIKEGGYYHNGVFTPVAFTWNFEECGLLLNLDDKTADLLINGVSQNLNITGIDSGLIYLCVGIVDSTLTRSFYLDTVAFTQSSYIPPLGYYKGFGVKVRSDVYTPVTPPAGNILVPDTPSSLLLGETAGVVYINAKNIARTVFSASENVWVIEFDKPLEGVFRFGICTSAHPTSVADEVNTNTIQLGNNSFSYGVEIDGTNCLAYHNGVSKPLTSNVESRIMSLILDMANKCMYVSINGSSLELVYENITPASYHVAMSTIVTQADGGITTYINTGRLANNAANNGLATDYMFQGFGAIIGNPPLDKLKTTYCNATTLMGVHHDGAGGVTDKIIQEYSFTCGYTLPSNITSGWDNTKASAGTAYSANGDMIHKLIGGLVSAQSHSTGKYYFEVLCNKQTLYVGVCQDGFAYDSGYEPGNEAYSIAFDTSQATLNQDWSQVDSTLYPDVADYWLNKTVGILINLDDNTMSVKYHDGTIKAVSGFTPLTNPLFVCVFAQDYSGMGIEGRNISVNLGQTAFANGLPAGYTAWFTP